MTTIEIDENVERMLRDQAQALHLEISEYLERLVAVNALPQRDTTFSNAELLSTMDKESDDVSSLPADFNRSDIYSDHD